MATTDSGNRSRAVTIAAGVLIAVVIVFFVRHLRSQPQIGPDDQVFKTVDALFTATTSKNTEQLKDCDQRLKTYRQNGKLPAAAGKRLDAIIKQAESGQWKESAKTLYDFMLAQRRQ